MNRRELYQKAEQALNDSLEAAKKSIRLVTQKAGEAAHVTQLFLEKVSLEHRVTKQFARLGGYLYEKAAEEGQTSLISDPGMKSLIDETRELENRLAQVETSLQKELRQKKLARKKPHR